jgi:hypothetical protein
MLVEKLKEALYTDGDIDEDVHIMLIVKTNEPYMKVEVCLTDIVIDFTNTDLCLSNKSKSDKYGCAYVSEVVKILEAVKFSLDDRIEIYSNDGNVIFDFTINSNTKFTVIPNYIEETEKHSGFCAIIFEILN